LQAQQRVPLGTRFLVANGFSTNWISFYISSVIIHWICLCS
jgi:hypothetical protein